jgi:Acetyltransferases, including N-acetylases of ribosomal proteins
MSSATYALTTSANTNGEVTGSAYLIVALVEKDLAVKWHTVRMKTASEHAFPDRFETECLVLRSWCTDDAEALFRYASDPEVGPMAGWPVHTSVADSTSIIETVLMKPGIYAVTLKKTGEPIGSIGLEVNEKLNPGLDALELGYWIAAPFWGNGYVGEAAQALIDYTFEELGVPVIWCGAFEENAKSRRVQEKLGFVFDREIKDFEFPLIQAKKTLIVTRLERPEA